MLSNKKGVEIAINFLVIIIFAAVIFVLGLVIFTQVFDEAEEAISRLGPQIQDEVQRKLQGGEVVAVYPSAMTVNRGKSSAFGVGIFNIGADKESFRVTRRVTEGFDNDDGDIPGLLTDHIIIAGGTLNFEIASRESSTRLFGIQVAKTAPSGIYIIEIDVVSQGDTYGDKRQVFVTVP